MRQFKSHYRKGLKVIDSCKTLEQAINARNYIEFIINSVPTYAKDAEYNGYVSRLRSRVLKKIKQYEVI